MVDTVRTISELLAIFADNTSGDITPQDIRDLVVTMENSSPSVPITATMSTSGIVGAGEFNMMGYYDCPAADSNLSQAGATQAYGTANSSYAAHVIAVSGGNGSTDAGNLTLTVTGTSITDAGVRTASDSEVIVADCTSSPANTMYESSKKWIGQVTYTLASDTGTTYSYDFNYGFASYNDLGNTNFTIDNFDFEWYGAANDSGFDIEIHVHEATGWTYHATAFVAGSAAKFSMQTDHVTEIEIVDGDTGKWKRTGLSEAVNGAASEGIICHVTTGTSKSIEWLNGSIRVKPTA